jgi:hypothetical protein
VPRLHLARWVKRRGPSPRPLRTSPQITRYHGDDKSHLLALRKAGLFKSSNGWSYHRSIIGPFLTLFRKSKVALLLSDRVATPFDGVCAFPAADGVRTAGSVRRFVITGPSLLLLSFERPLTRSRDQSPRRSYRGACRATYDGFSWQKVRHCFHGSVGNSWRRYILPSRTQCPTHEALSFVVTNLAVAKYGSSAASGSRRAYWPKFAVVVFRHRPTFIREAIRSAIMVGRLVMAV